MSWVRPLGRKLWGTTSGGQPLGDNFWWASSGEHLWWQPQSNIGTTLTSE
jgi:hypothetical protein